MTTPDEPESNDSRPATFEHILRVGGLIIELVTDMLGRATTHDLSKTRPPEVEGFDRASWRLKTMAYDSPEYAASRAELPDKTELLLRFVLPLPVPVVAELAEAVGSAAKRLGYTDVHLLADGRDTWAVVGTPPDRPVFLFDRDSIDNDETRETSPSNPGE